MKKKAPKKSTPWYVRAFNADYLARYKHRSDASARAELPFIISVLKLPPNATVLDLCCGAGRHARALAAMRPGLRVLALDLSEDLLRDAQRRNRTRRRLCFIRGDNRALPLAPESLDGVMNLFTSFGYFDTGREHLRVLQEAARALKPGGRFVLDFMNSARTLANLVARSEREIEGGRIVETRRYDSKTGRLCKHISIEKLSPSGKYRAVESIEESVRAYTPEELRSLLNKAGLRVLKVYGDLHGAKFEPESSPRCVLVSVKEKSGVRSRKSEERSCFENSDF